ncbi:MAG: HAD-IC family P-type ATPase, partial [Moorella sp. (in: Bacteria)]|nr:HAD-IC family P-type ATPase [Moorella sp. (in: firmicutes)]
LVEKAATRKAPTEQFITTFSRYYTPAVVIGALAVAVIPPLVIPGATFSAWVYRALVLLVISCPCALMVSIPLGYFGGIGAASRRGILVKGANFLDALTNLHTVVFDKTGTLTQGVFRVIKVVPYNGFKEEDLLAAAAAAELHSNHPIAQSIRAAYGREISPDRVNEYRELPGHGISAVVDGKRVLAGNDHLLHREGIPH